MDFDYTDPNIGLNMSMIPMIDQTTHHSSGFLTQENDTLAGSLAFWMANASELLHFLKQDTSLSLFTESAQGILAKSVQHAFRYAIAIIKGHQCKVLFF